MICYVSEFVWLLRDGCNPRAEILGWNAVPSRLELLFRRFRLIVAGESVRCQRPSCIRNLKAASLCVAFNKFARAIRTEAAVTEMQ